MIIGSVLGFLMGRYRYARAFFHDLIYLAANVPLIVYAIVAIIVFGISGMGPTSVVILFVLPGIALNVAAGMMSVDPDLVGMSKSFNRSRVDLVKHVIIPTVTAVRVRRRAGVVRRLVEAGRTRRNLRRLKRCRVSDLAAPITCSRCSDVLAWMGFFVIFVVLLERLVLVNARAPAVPVARRNTGTGVGDSGVPVGRRQRAWRPMARGQLGGRARRHRGDRRGRRHGGGKQEGRPMSAATAVEAHGSWRWLTSDRAARYTARLLALALWQAIGSALRRVSRRRRDHRVPGRRGHAG